MYEVGETEELEETLARKEMKRQDDEFWERSGSYIHTLQLKSHTRE